MQRNADTTYNEKIKQWLNFSQDYAFRFYDYYEELESTYTFTTVNGTESYFLPPHFDKPLRIFDVTNNTKMQIVTEENYQEVNLSNILNSSTGRPAKARIFGTSAVDRAIAATGITLKAKSSSTLDSSGIVVRIEGFIDSALTVLDYENITIGSISPTAYATATSPKTFYKITRVVKSIDSIGYITVADSSGNVMAIIASTERQSRYPELRLGLIPADAYSFRILFKRRINKLVNDNDYPFLDADEFFVCNAVGYGMSEEKESIERANQMWQKAQAALQQVVRNQQSRLGPDFQHKMISKIAQSHRV